MPRAFLWSASVGGTMRVESGHARSDEYHQRHEDENPHRHDSCEPEAISRDG
jgi:hypothetical protein